MNMDSGLPPEHDGLGEPAAGLHPPLPDEGSSGSLKRVWVRCHFVFGNAYFKVASPDARNASRGKGTAFLFSSQPSKTLSLTF